MEREAWMDRIVVDPKRHGGEPCIKGTRIPVGVIVASIADGDSVEDLLKVYPALTREDIRHCATLHYVFYLRGSGNLCLLSSLRSQCNGTRSVDGSYRR